MLNGNIYDLAADPDIKRALDRYKPKAAAVDAVLKRELEPYVLEAKTRQERIWQDRAKKRLDGSLKKSRRGKKRLPTRSDLKIANVLYRRWIADESKAIYNSIRSDLSKDGVSVEFLRSSLRNTPICLERDRIIWIAWKNSGQTVAAIGRYFRRSHGAILHSIKLHEARLQKQGELNG